MGKTIQGVEMSTPEFSRVMAEGFVADYMRKEDQLLYEQDWERWEPTVCTACNGTKKRPDLGEDCCHNCDSTGAEHVLFFGMKGGQSYAYTKEFGMKAKLEFCKAMRESFQEVQDAGKVSNLSLVRPYALPKTIEMELMARGLNVNDKSEANVRQIANIVAKDYPQFLCVPYNKF